MSMMTRKSLSFLTAALFALLMFSPVSFADDRSLMRNPMVKQTAIGAGVGAAAGALSRETSVVKGAGIGALTGLGTGAIDSTGVLNRRPLVRSAAKGAVIGTGASAVMDRSKMKGAAVGAGAGAGYHLIRDYMNNR